MSERSSYRARTGLLIHGRNLQARGWEEMVWGPPDVGRLGTLPTAVLAMLDEGPSNIALLIIGSGGSTSPDGRSEADITKQLFISKFNDLNLIPTISSHPRWSAAKEKVRKLVDSAVVDNITRNTKEEIANAACMFAEHDINSVIHVTGASHGPRCQQLQAVARETGVIPAGQRWRLVTDDIPYPGTSAGDTLVMEEPHRLDDPMQHVARELRPAQLFSRFYYVIPTERRPAFLEELAQLIERYE